MLSLYVVNLRRVLTRKKLISLSIKYLLSFESYLPPLKELPGDTKNKNCVLRQKKNACHTQWEITFSTLLLYFQWLTLNMSHQLFYQNVDRGICIFIDMPVTYSEIIS